MKKKFNNDAKTLDNMRIRRILQLSPKDAPLDTSFFLIGGAQTNFLAD